MSETISPTWPQIDRLCQQLALLLLQKDVSCQRLVAIARGGLVPAAILSQILRIHLIDTICIQSYNYKQQNQPKILKKVPSGTSGTRTLVIDDIATTGITIEKVKQILPGAHYATLYTSQAGLVDTSCVIIPITTWVKFPWEKD